MKLELDPAQRARIGWLTFACVAGSLALGALTPIATSVAFHKMDSAGWLAAGVVYLCTLGFSNWTRRYHAPELASLFDKTITQMRISLVAKIRRSELRTVESLGNAENATNEIEQLARLPVTFLDAIRLAFSTLTRGFYVLLLSGPGFLVWCGTLTAIAWIAGPRLKQIHGAHAEFDESNSALETTLDRIEHGFAQLRVDSALRKGLHQELREESQSWMGARLQLDEAARGLLVGAHIMLLVGLCVLLFATPLRSITTSTRGQLVAMMFFLSSVAIFALRELPTFSLAWIAWEGVRALSERLGDGGESRTTTPVKFERIDLRALTFSYPGRAFQLGPIDLSLAAGELVFVVGGNGSGKTTLLKLLTGLYPPAAGHIELNGLRIDSSPAGRAQLRELCSAVFAEHHLFERLYGLQVEPARFEMLIDRLGLRGVIRMHEGDFERLSLSSGQSKRLALLVALLEDRPVLVLDEWAAHQDPETRKWFYTELLPELRAQGRGVLVISHDDRFYSLADRVVRLSRGRVDSQQEPVK